MSIPEHIRKRMLYISSEGFDCGHIHNRKDWEAGFQMCYELYVSHPEDTPLMYEDIEVGHTLIFKMDMEEVGNKKGDRARVISKSDDDRSISLQPAPGKDACIIYQAGLCYLKQAPELTQSGAV